MAENNTNIQDKKIIDLDALGVAIDEIHNEMNQKEIISNNEPENQPVNCHWIKEEYI